MAIYIPGVQDFIPQLEVFTPDYKFLSDVLDTRQDRYTTNYDQLNDLYGKVVYADLSRNDNKEKRDQYANQLSGRIHQITGMDLSLQQNVDAARGLFKPFYDDDLIVKDMVFTEQYKKEMETVQMMQDSPNEKVSEQYWDYGVKALNYQMKDFIAADPSKAMKMNSPRYVPDADLYDRAIAKLKESGMSLTGTTFEGDWIVKQKNGSILVKPAREFIEQSLLDDAKVKNAYYTKAYVLGREWGEKNADQYGSEDRAKKVWAESILKTYHQNQKLSLANTNVELQDGIRTQANWDEYQEQYGIVINSKQDKEYMKMLAEVAMLNEVKDMKTKKLRVQAEPVKDLDQLLNKAYAAIMSEDIGEDMTAAAVSYANIDASISVKVNPIRKMKHEQNFKKYMADNLQRNKENNAYQKFLYDVELKVLDAEIDAAAALAEGKNSGAWSDEAQGTVRNDIEGTAYSPLMVEGEDDVIDYFTENDVTEMKDMQATQALKMQLLAETGTMLKNQSQYTYDIVGENGQIIEQTKTWPEAKKDLMKPENSDELDRLFTETQTNLYYASDKRPTWLKKEQGESYEILSNLSNQIDNRMRRSNSTREKQDAFYGLLQDQFTSTAYGKEWNAMYEDGMPSIFMSDGYRQGMKEGSESDEARAGISKEEWMKLMIKDGHIEYEDKLNKKLISKEEYIKHYMDYAEKTGAREKGDIAAGLSTGLLGSGYDSPYWKYQKPRAAGNLNYGKDAMILGSQPYAASAGRWIFDGNQARKDANNSYDDQRAAYNGFMGRTPGAGEGDELAFSFKEEMAGRPQGGLGAKFSPGYSFVYDHANQNPKAKVQLQEMFRMVHGISANRILRFGNEGGNLNNTADERKAKFVLENFWRDVYTTFGKDNDKTGSPNLTVTYAENLGGEGAEGKYAGYILEFSPAYAKALKSGRDDVPGKTNEFIELGEWKDNTVTVFIKKEFDNNPYSSANYQPSYVALAVEDEGEVVYEQYPGGGIKFFKNSQGQLMEQTWNYQYDGNPESTTFAEYIKTIQQPILLTHKGAQMDAYALEIKRFNGTLAANQNKIEADTKLMYPDRVRKKAKSIQEEKFGKYETRNMQEMWQGGLLQR